MRILLILIIAFSSFALWETGIMPYEKSSDNNLLRIVNEIESSKKFNLKNNDFSIAEQLCLS